MDIGTDKVYRPNYGLIEYVYLSSMFLHIYYLIIFSYTL